MHQASAFYFYKEKILLKNLRQRVLMSSFIRVIKITTRNKTRETSIEQRSISSAKKPSIKPNKTAIP